MKQIVNFQIQVTLGESGDSAEVRISTDTLPPPLLAVMVAAEHMMNAMAVNSEKDYEEALALLCEGARKSRTIYPKPQ